MKKILSILLFGLLFSCSHYSQKQPIEKYFGENYIIWNIEECPKTDYVKHINLRNNEGFLKIYVLDFDIELYNLKVGDTLK
jgi:hypothetical protein